MIERKIITGLITSSEYCSKIKEIWNPLLIESSTAKQLSNWCWEYYDKYKKAPGKEIETIYYSKLKDNKLQKDIAEEIGEDILPGLSEEYTNEEFNLQYLIEETEKYFNSQHLKLFADNIQGLLTAGEIGKANELADGFRPLDVVFGSLDDFILTANQIRGKGKERPKLLMKPWLREGQTTILYGNYGSGKSLLAISIAYVLGLKDFDGEDCEIGQWQVKNPTGTLYIDGELGEVEMEERVGQFEWLGEQKYKMRVFSIPEYQLVTEDTFYLSNRENQQKVIKWLHEHPRYKLIILDSISTLFGLEEENSNSEWSNKINPFLKDLRALGVACLMLHHSGKDSKRGLRGASAMGAMAHNIFRLENHREKSPDRGEAWFNVSKDKQRSAGLSFRPFSLKYVQDEDKVETHWEVTGHY